MGESSLSNVISPTRAYDYVLNSRGLLSVLFFYQHYFKLCVCYLFISLKGDVKLPLMHKCVDAVNRGLFYSYTNLKEY